MKKLILLAAIILTGTFVFATNGLEKILPQNNINIVKIENIDHNKRVLVEQIETLKNNNEQTVPCRWRTCTYVNGVRQGCTDWTYGECNRGPDGLEPIR